MLSDLAAGVANAVEDLLSGWFETTKRSFLEPVRDCPDQQNSAQVGRRTGTKYRRPFQPQRWYVEREKVSNFLRQLF